MAVILFTLLILAGVVITALCMVQLGILRIPEQVTRSICNATHERNNFYYHQNFTIIKEVEKNSSMTGMRL
jgi:hypothetical protein